MTKLEQLCEIEGLTVEELVKSGTFDGTCYGICTNEGCEYTTEVEPDQTQGWCEVCNTQTVKSGLILAGII